MLSLLVFYAVRFSDMEWKFSPLASDYSYVGERTSVEIYCDCSHVYEHDLTVVSLYHIDLLIGRIATGNVIVIHAPVCHAAQALIG